MTKSTRNLLRIISILIALSIVLMEVNVIPNLFTHHFWVMVIAYALLMFTIR